MSCPRTRRRPLVPAATVINAACSCLAMAAQVVQEAPGGGDGAGRAVDGLGGGAGRGSLHPGDGRDGVGEQIAGRLDEAGTGWDVHLELVRVDGLGADVIQLRPDRQGVVGVAEQAEQAKRYEPAGPPKWVIEPQDWMPSLRGVYTLG